MSIVYGDGPSAATAVSSCSGCSRIRKNFAETYPSDEALVTEFEHGKDGTGLARRWPRLICVLCGRVHYKSATHYILGDWE